MICERKATYIYIVIVKHGRTDIIINITKRTTLLVRVTAVMMVIITSCQVYNIYVSY